MLVEVGPKIVLEGLEDKRPKFVDSFCFSAIL